MTLDDIFNKLKEDLDRDKLIDEASKLLYRLDSPLTLWQEEGGAVGHILLRRVQDEVGRDFHLDVGTTHADKVKVVRQLMEAVNIPWGFIPPVPLVREAMALLVQVRRVLKPVVKSPNVWSDYYDAIGMLFRAGAAYEHPDEVYKLPLETAEAVADRLK